MNSERASLAARRTELVALCARQRGDLAEECAALKMPFAGGVRGWLGAQKTVTLALAGVALGLIATRPKRILSLAAGALSMWKVARNVLPMLTRPGTENH